MSENSIKLSDYYMGGYYITKYVERPPYSAKSLLPEKIFSISSCISKFIPDTWTISWTNNNEDERLDGAHYFGLHDKRIKEVTEWATENFKKEFGTWSAFYSLSSACNFRDIFLAGQEDLIIFGIGLHKSYFDTFSDTAKPPPQQPGYAPVGKTGIYECIIRKENLDQRGHILGFELAVLHYGSLSCSWLCNGLEKYFHDELNISLNKGGFIDTFELATKCVDMISNNNVGAEPGLWLPWLMVKYIQ